MNKMYLLATVALMLTGCEAVTKSRLKGKYEYIGDGRSNVVPKIEFTGSKAIFPGFLSGTSAFDYQIEDGYAFVSMAGVGGPQARFKIVSADTLTSDNMGCEGTYIRVKD